MIISMLPERENKQSDDRIGTNDKNHPTNEALDKKELMTSGFGGCYVTKKSIFRTH